jgi:hypothetical protein
VPLDATCCRCAPANRREGHPPTCGGSPPRLHAGGDPLGYTGPLGTAELRQAIAEHHRRWYGLDVDPASVAITTGASGAFVLVFLAAFDAGDRVAVVRPGYPAYRNLLHALDLEPVEIAVGPRPGSASPPRRSTLQSPPTGRSQGWSWPRRRTPPARW